LFAEKFGTDFLRLRALRRERTAHLNRNCWTWRESGGAMGDRQAA